MGVAASMSSRSRGVTATTVGVGGSPVAGSGVVLLDVGTWGNEVTCRTSLFVLDREAHSRLNTLYFTFRFLGIACGSLAGTVAWSRGGGPAVTLLGSAAALAVLYVVCRPRAVKGPATAVTAVRARRAGR
ncbi:hypothetical protein ACWCP6_25485 [Streptomyces sp. NPDC002004]